MEKRELEEILAAHKLWVESNQMNGIRGSFRDANLKKENLQNLDLKWFNFKGADLQGANLEKTNLQGANLQEANFQEAKLQEAKLQGASFHRTNFQNADLSNAKIQKSELERIHFQGANLQNVNFYGSRLNETNFSEADLRGANLIDTNLNRAVFFNSDLRGGRLRSAFLSNSDLRKADLRGANFQKSNLTEANLEEANLQEADFLEANLSDANLNKTNLEGAKFQGAKLLRAQLRASSLIGANLRGANFQRADLRNANLRNADLFGTDFWNARVQAVEFEGTEIDGANFCEAKIENANFKGANIEHMNIGKKEYYELPKDIVEKYKENIFVSGMIEDDRIITRPISFPFVYNQAIMTILSYFFTVIRSKYPDIVVSVTLQQQGTTLVMEVETPEGEKDLVEKVLNDYAMVIKGEKLPEDFLSDPHEVTALYNVLDMAKAGIKFARQPSSINDEDHDNRFEEEVKWLRIQLSKSLDHSIKQTEIIENISYRQIDSLQEFLKSLLEQNHNIKDELSILLNKISIVEPNVKDIQEFNASLVSIKEKDPNKFGEIIDCFNQFGIGVAGSVWASVITEAINLLV